MTQTVFEKMKNAISVLKLDFTTEEFATFADEPEELPTAPVMTRIRQLPRPSGELSFAKFDFDGEEPV